MTVKGSRAGASITSPLYFCFFCSGLSGLIYQVVWVRMFGNVFGNTISSASIVVAVFMLGLGVGSYAVGRWADRRYAAHPESLLRAFGGFELAIGVTGLALAGVLPHLGRISASASSYTTSDNGWLVLSVASHAARAAMAILLLTPITLLMGGTLTLLIRYLVRTNVQVETPRIAVLYAVNTAGAAAGAFLTDFALVPAAGLRATQLVALFFNLAAAGVALALARLARNYAAFRNYLVEHGKIAEALPAAEKAVRYEPAVAANHLHLGFLAYLAGTRDRALQAFATARQLSLNFKQAWDGALKNPDFTAYGKILDDQPLVKSVLN